MQFKKLILPILIILAVNVHGQNDKVMISGFVSFKSSQNIYVRFESTSGIEKGDTIFAQKLDSFVPLLKVENLSSLSCMGKSLNLVEVDSADIVYAFIPNPEIVDPDIVKDPVSVNIPEEIKPVEEAKTDSVFIKERKQRIYGKASASSYLNFSNTDFEARNRLRYRVALNIENIADSRFSADSYIVFSHKLKQWDEVKDNIYSALKIYSLSAKYELKEHSSIWIGRKINPNASNIGAVDGIQTETRIKNFSTGIIAGSRPDYEDYSFNSKLFQYGAYLSHNLSNSNGRMQSSLAFFNQTNNGNLDRRYVYLQSNSSLVKNLFLFTSIEADLYSITDSLPNYNPSFTSAYFSLKYRFSSKLSANVSYDARKNVIYYETYKNYIDALLEDALRQGLQLRVNYRPAKYIQMGIHGTYRKREGDFQPTQSLNGFVTFTRIPVLNASASLSANHLQTSYLIGNIYGIRFSKDFLEGQIYGSLNYKLMDYNYVRSESSLMQHVGSLSVSYRVNKNISLSTDYELSIQNPNIYQRLYFSFSMRI